MEYLLGLIFFAVLSLLGAGISLKAWFGALDNMAKGGDDFFGGHDHAMKVLAIGGVLAHVGFAGGLALIAHNYLG